MPYFDPPCSLPQSRVLLPCQMAEICRSLARVWVLKPLMWRILSVVKCVDALVGIDFFPAVSRAAGKIASTASATIAAPFGRRVACGIFRGRETPNQPAAARRVRRTRPGQVCRRGLRREPLRRAVVRRRRGGLPQEEGRQLPQRCHGCVGLVELVPRRLKFGEALQDADRPPAL
jgi:hypothetical protein